MAGKTLTRSDVTALLTPTIVSVPKSIDAATEVLDGVGGLLSAGHWGTAAIVWAFTEDQQGSNQHRAKVHDALGINEFAALGIRGLKSNNSVIKYRQAWQHAIDEGWAEPAEPGKRCVLPDQPFEFPKIDHETAKTPPPPPGQYNLIYADPPWQYRFAESNTREIENHYPTMELDAICELSVPAADSCVLFLWGTSPKLAEAMQVIEAWEFDYKTCMVWVKNKIGMGYYARQKHELLLIATKGDPGTPKPVDRPPSVIDADRGEHSRKPELFYDLLEAMYPNAQRIELFCRKAVPGWDAWGNEVATT